MARRRGGGRAREEDVSGLAGTQSRGAQLVPDSRYRRIALPVQSHFAWTQAAQLSSQLSAGRGGGTGQETEDVGRREKFLFKPELKPGEIHGKETTEGLRRAVGKHREGGVGAALIDRTITANGQRQTPPGGIPLYTRLRGGVVS